jgi:hypothetical protein
MSDSTDYWKSPQEQAQEKHIKEEAYRIHAFGDQAYYQEKKLR